MTLFAHVDKNNETEVLAIKDPGGGAKLLTFRQQPWHNPTQHWGLVLLNAHTY